jgi:hypothetical protein
LDRSGFYSDLGHVEFEWGFPGFKMVRAGNTDTFTIFELDENCRNFGPILITDID